MEFKQTFITNRVSRYKKPSFLVFAIGAYVLSMFGFLVPVYVQVAQAAAGVPKIINFQGKLTAVANGTNVPNGTYAFEFKLYDALTSGSLLWTETYDQPSGACSKLTVTNGVFNAKLGSCNALSGVDFTDDSRYISINFAPTGTSYDGEMSPRKQLTAVAYALNASNLVGDGKISITNATGPQATIGYDSSNKLQVSVASNGFNTLTANGAGAGYALMGGNVGIGTTTVSAKLHSLATTEQLRLGYDASNYSSFTVSSGGNLTVAPSGGTLNVTGTQTISSILQVGSATATTYSRLGTASTSHTLSGANALLVSGNLEVDGSTFFDGTVTAASSISTATLTASGAIAANGGITFDNATDTVGAHTLAGTLDANLNILTNIGNSGTDFIASTGALTLAGVLTANGGITVAANQALVITGGAGNPTATNGTVWYDTTANKYKIVENGVVKTICNTTDAGCGAGGAATLQSAYDNDADGSDTIITMGAADDSLIFTNPSASGTDSAFTVQIDQANTTAAVLGLDILQRSNAANAINITANAIDGETGVALTANALTSGNGLTIDSSATAFTGALAKFTLSGSNASNTGSIIRIDNTGTNSATTGLYINHLATGSGNLALRIDDIIGDTTPLIVDGDGRLGIGTTSIGGSTERLLQVGSPTNRGNMVAYGDVVSEGRSKIQALTGIKDIFLYDTTADSDGGKWIDWATTDQLSWYTESLDDGPSDPCDITTDDRCYTTHFPRKALIAVTTNALYIFDESTGTMWMKFSQNAAGYALGADANNDPSSVTAVNGVIYVGTNGSSQGGLYVIDFVNDRMWNIDGTDRSGADVGISGRNAVVTYNSDNTTAFDLSTVGTAAEWEDINDVSAAYINSSSTAIATGAATNTSPGSGQTFVALATDSGITILNMTAQKVLQYSDVTADDYTSVVLTRRGRMYALNTTSDQLEQWNNFDTDKASEVNGTYDAKYDETVGPALWSSTPNIIAGAPDALEVIERGSLAEDTSDIVYVGHSLGLTEIHTHSTQTNGWSKFFDTTRQTMLMPNSIDMALMMDDTSGTQANDISFNNTDMAIFGTPTLGVSGVRGKAIQFDNTNDFLCSDADQNNVCDVDASFNMSTTGWTLSMWFKHSTTAPASGADTLFEKCVTATPAQATGCIIVYMTTTGTIVSANDTDATWTRPDVGAASYNITATSSLAYNDNQWHQLIVTRTNANDVDTFIDGNPLNLSTATGGTTTFDGSQIVTIGASCSTTTGANCAAANATNFWDGAIDDVTFSAGATTVSTFSALQARRFYNDARPLVAKKVITVTDATTATSTTIGDSGESWIPNELAGMIVTLTGNTGAGQTRRIISNTTNTLTVNPAFTTAPDTTTDFEIDPEALFGATNSVYAIGVTKQAPLGQARQMCIGTNSSTDTGGVTCYNHQAGPNIIADLFHADAKQLDDSDVEWTGTDYDDIRSIDMTARDLVIGSEAHFYAETGDVRLGQGLDYLANQLSNIRSEIINDGITLAGSQALEIGFTGGADLAEYYYSTEPIEFGDVVIIDSHGDGDDVLKSKQRYSGGLLGVVSTQPGIVLGQKAEDGFPIALTGRVPVKFSTENGPVKAGDYLTSASIPGYAMRATGAGPTIGKALTDSPSDADMTDCVVSDLDSSFIPKCGHVMIFVEHGNFSGLPIEQLMEEMQISVSSEGALIEGSIEGLVEGSNTTTDNALNDTGLASTSPELTTDEKILVFLKHIKETRLAKGEGISAQLFTDRVSAAFEVVTPQVTTSGLKVETIGKLGTNLDFLSDVTFIGRPYLNNDTGGFALIKKGQTKIDVTFEKEYLEQPVVSASITGEIDPAIIKAGDMEKITALQNQQDQLAVTVFQQGIQALVIKKSVNGFTIIINKPAPEDITFSWIALAIKNPKLFTTDTQDQPSEVSNNEQAQTPTVAGTSDTASQTEEPIIEHTDSSEATGQTANHVSLPNPETEEAPIEAHE